MSASHSAHRFVGAALILAILVVGTCVTLMRGMRFRQSAQLRVAPEALYFGEVWAQTDFSWTLPIENRSDATVTILDLIPSCGCAAVKVDALPATLDPGDTAYVRVTVDLTRAETEVPSDNAGETAIPFAIRLKERAPVHIELHGTIKRSFVASPSLLQYGETLTKGTPFASREVAVRPLTPLAQVRGTCDGAVGSVRVNAPVNDDAPWTLTFTPRSDLPIGPFGTSIEIRSETPGGEQIPPVVLPVIGNVMPEIRAIPEVLSFGVCSLGDVVEGATIVQSASGRRCEVVDVKVVADDGNAGSLSVKSVEGGSRASHKVVLSFCLRARGHNGAKVVLTVRNADGELTRLSVLVSGYAEASAGLAARGP